jgi:hypothetical protein
VAKKTTRKSRVQAADDTGQIEVEEVTTVEEKPAKPPAGIETWLITLTFFALLWAGFLINLKLHEVSGKGWPF